MGVNLNCDECNRFIRTIKAQDIAKMRMDEDTVCDICLAKIETWYKKIDAAGNDVIAEINEAKREAKAKFEKVVHDRKIQEGRS